MNTKLWMRGLFWMVGIALAGAPCTAFAQGGSVEGKVNFTGTPPAPQPINFGAEKQCAVMHGDKAPLQEDLVVNGNGTVKWALVYVKEGVTGTFEAPKDPVVVDQNGCVFSPHASAALVGQTVRFVNSDTLLHNVRTESKLGQSFNIAQPIQGMKTEKLFKQQEIGVKVRCDVHFWMAAYLHILSHPYFAVTGDAGGFVIKDLAPGTYTVEVWHEKLGTQTQTVTVAEGESKTVDFELKKI